MSKDSARIELNGAVDEAQAAIGLARAHLLVSRPGTEANDVLLGVERDLWVLMAEVATAPRNRGKLVAGASLVTAAMVDALEQRVHALEASGAVPSEFVLPGGDLPSAALDVARTVVRRAERLAVRAKVAEDSLVVPYLNRLSDLLWLLARAAEAHAVTARGT